MTASEGIIEGQPAHPIEASTLSFVRDVFKEYQIDWDRTIGTAKGLLFVFSFRSTESPGTRDAPCNDEAPGTNNNVVRSKN